MMRTHSRILAALLLAITLAACVWASNAQTTYCTFCCTPNCGGANGNSTPSPTATPSPSPSPSPSPTPSPTPDFVVAPSGGTHTSIGAAYSAASCGDLIWVRDGTYTLNAGLFLNKNCTSGNELVIQNYPDESPKVTCNNPETDAKRVNITGPYHVWDGIEIYSCYNGINLHSSNVKILNSKIHNNILNGILFVNNGGKIENVEIAGNTIEVNGYVQSDTCTVGVKSSCTPHVAPWNPEENVSPKNSHSVYLSQGNNCNGIDGVHIHGNHLRHAGGRAIQLNGSECSGGDPDVRNVLIENNTIENNSWGISIFYGAQLVTIQDNTFVGNSWPNTNDDNHTFIGMWNLANSEIKGNSFSSSSSSMQPLFFVEGSDCPSNDISSNTWSISTNNWIWNGGGRSDFSTNFTSVSGCGANDVFN